MKRKRQKKWYQFGEHTMYLLSLLLLMAIAVTASCGGGGGGGDGDGGGGGGGLTPASFAGTWYGVLQTSATSSTAYFNELGVTVDSSGRITDIKIDGLSDTSLASSASPVAITATSYANVFGFVLNNGEEGGFVADSSGTHAGFLNITARDFGVVQKGATSLPSYADADTVGTWSGYGVVLDSYGDIVQTFSSNATVQTGNTFTGSGLDGAFTGYITVYYPFYGKYQGPWDDNDTSDLGIVSIFLSVDKRFAASYACDGAVYDPSVSSCSFIAWNKQ